MPQDASEQQRAVPMDELKSLFKDNALVFNNPIDLLAVECKATGFWNHQNVHRAVQGVRMFVAERRRGEAQLHTRAHAGIAVPYSTTKKSNDMNRRVSEGVLQHFERLRLLGVWSTLWRVFSSKRR